MIGQLYPEKWETVKYPEKVVNNFQLIQEIITSIRNLRAEARIEPALKIEAVVYGGNKTKLIEENQAIIKNLARLKDLKISSQGEKPSPALAKFVEKVEIYLPTKDFLDPKKESERLQKEIGNLENYLKTLNKKLGNDSFMENAPAEVVKNEKEKKKTTEEKLVKLEKQLGEVST